MRCAPRCLHYPCFIRPAFRFAGGGTITTGHVARLERIDAALAPYPGLFLTGNSYRGVAVNACIEDAKRVAARVTEHVRTIERHTEFAIAR